MTDGNTLASLKAEIDGLTTKIDSPMADVETLRDEIKTLRRMVSIGHALTMEGGADRRRVIARAFTRAAEHVGATDPASERFKKALFDTAPDLHSGTLH